MSGYVVADSQALVMQKVGTNVKYKVTKDQFALIGQNNKRDPPDQNWHAV